MSEPEDEFGELIEDFDELENLRDPRAVRKELRRRLKSDGVQTAFETMLDICADKKAPAPARATAAATIFRAAGYLSSKAADEDDSEGLTLDKLSKEQLDLLGKFYSDKAQRLTRGAPATRKRRAKDEGGGGGGAFD